MNNMSKTERILLDVLFALVLIGVLFLPYHKATWEIPFMSILVFVWIRIRNEKKPTINFVKFQRKAIIPSKNKEDLGYDIYPCFDEETKYIEIKPHETKLIPTGIGSNMNHNFGIILKERGSTGSKGMGIRSGVIDSGYKGEWFVGITNHNDVPLYICKKNWVEFLKQKRNIDEHKYIVYPYEKAICQAIVVPNYNCKIKEIHTEEFEKIKTNRDDGKLGSSGK